MNHSSTCNVYWENDGSMLDLPFGFLLSLIVTLCIASAITGYYAFPISAGDFGFLAFMSFSWGFVAFEFCLGTIYKYDVIRFRKAIAHINSLDLRSSTQRSS